jgi:endonuclease/exonuclease/phosphatase family metal-dependent hydrolase
VLRVATYNIHRGRGGLAGPFRPDRIAAVIAEIAPDLIALQEAQHYFSRRTAMLDAEALARELGLRLLQPRAEQQGWRSNLVLARADAVLRHGPIGLPLGGWEPRGALLAELDFGEGPFRLLATHLSLGAARRARQAQALLGAMQAGHALPTPLPTLLLGDLNEWRARGAALRVLAPVFGTPPPMPTFPAFRPTLSLDRILAHPAGRLHGLAAHDTPLARAASDHLPLTAWFDDGAAAASQVQAAASAG